MGCLGAGSSRLGSLLEPDPNGHTILLSTARPCHRFRVGVVAWVVDGCCAGTSWGIWGAVGDLEERRLALFRAIRVTDNGGDLHLRYEYVQHQTTKPHSHLTATLGLCNTPNIVCYHLHLAQYAFKSFVFIRCKTKC